MSLSTTPLKCTRCRHVMTHGDLVARLRPGKSSIGLSDLVCPKCGCKSYYDLTPQVAWCWASGLIEIGDSLPPDSPSGGAIEIARGPKFALKSQLAAMARHGMGQSSGQLLVPGVPEADGQRAKGDALEIWLAWCGKRKSRDGVTFSQAVSR